MSEHEEPISEHFFQIWNISDIFTGNYYSNRRSNQATKKCGRSNASIYAGVGATTFYKFVFSLDLICGKVYA